MKKIIATLVLVAAATFNAQAQGVEIKTNPFGSILGAYNVTAEIQLAELSNTTVLVSAWYNTEDFKDWLYTDKDGGFSAGVRKYFNRYTDEGIFLGAAARYIPRSISGGYYDYNTYEWVDTGDRSSDYASLGFTVGYKYVYNDKITIDAFMGGGRILWEQNEGDMWAPAEFISGFNFGYRF